jgi:hypothetical protein
MVIGNDWSVDKKTEKGSRQRKSSELGRSKTEDESDVCRTGGRCGRRRKETKQNKCNVRERKRERGDEDGLDDDDWD